MVMDEQHDAGMASPPETPWTRLRGQPWLLALVVATVALVVALVAMSVAFVRSTRTTVQIVPTATPTEVVLPTPTNRPGYHYYSEAPSHFQIQYPLAWQTVPQNPGVEIDDNTAAPSYIMQILLPTQNLDVQTDWIQYEFKNLKGTTGTTGFTQVGGRAVVSINGVAWTSASAQLQQGPTAISVRVMVTVYRDRVYIINLLAANTSMEVAQARYFNDMLGTFTFLA
jgi:hypothetical protein